MMLQKLIVQSRNFHSKIELQQFTKLHFLTFRGKKLSRCNFIHEKFQHYILHVNKLRHFHDEIFEPRESKNYGKSTTLNVLLS